MDIVEQNIKRANEKKKKWDTFDYKGSKHRNLYTVSFELNNRLRACEDKTFEKIAENRFRKKYA